MLRYFYIVFFVIGLASSLYPQAGQLFVQSFEAREYNGHTQNWSITQNPDGLIYVANGKGVLEYDGSTWRLITVTNKSVVRSVASDSSGRIYVGAKNEFGYLKANATGYLEFVSLRPKIEAGIGDFGDVWETIVTKQGVYFRSPHQVFRFDLKTNSLRHWAPKTRFSLGSLIDDEFCVIQKGIGLTKFVDDSLVIINNSTIFKDKSVYSLLPLSNGKILVGTANSGLYFYDGEPVKFKTQIDLSLENDWLSHASRLPDGTLAIATRYRGIYIVDMNGKVLHHITGKTGLRDNSVWYTYVDRQGGLWAALNNGLARIEASSSLSFFGKVHGLEGKVLDIKRFRNRLYVATSPAGVYFLDAGKNGSSSQFRRVSGIETQCWSLLPFQNHLLVAANNGFFSIVNDRSKLLLPAQRDRFEPALLKRSLLDSNLVLAGLYNGMAVLKHQDGEWINCGRINGVAGEIRTAVQLDDGTVWLGSRNNGVYKLDLLREKSVLSEDSYLKANLKHYGEDKLPPGQSQVFAVNRRVVVATESLGLFAFDPKDQRFYPDSTFGKQFADGTVDVEVVEKDAHRNLWFGSEEAGRVDFVQFQNGGYVEKLKPTKRIEKSPIMCIYSENEGIVWFSTIDGLVRFNDNKEERLTIPFRTLIRQIRTKQDSVIYAGHIDKNTQPKQTKLHYSLNSVSFLFAASNYVAGGNTLFRSRLAGFDKEWSRWNNEQERNYTNLSPGHYQFLVQSQNVYGLLGDEARFSFSIEPPFYRTWVAYIFYLFLFGSLLLAIRRYELRRNYLRLEARRKNAEIEEARKLQLSLLPAAVPQCEQADIGVFMKTATEVGGDYYNFHAENGSLSIVLGDATGHGLNAGMMVIAAKSTLASLMRLESPKEILAAANNALKKLGLGRLYMALQLLKIEKHRATVATAGMPAILWHRCRENSVTDILLKAMPLGAFTDYEYKQQEITLNAGDTLLMMSDGFHERINDRGEILGYDEAKNVLQQIAHQSVEDIINYLVRYSDQWANGEVLNDDMTFVVVRIK